MHWWWLALFIILSSCTIATPEDAIDSWEQASSETARSHEEAVATFLSDATEQSDEAIRSLEGKNQWYEASRPVVDVIKAPQTYAAVRFTHITTTEAESVDGMTLMQFTDTTTTLIQSPGVTPSLMQSPDGTTTSMQSPDGITTSMQSLDGITTSMQSPDRITTSMQLPDRTTTSMQSFDGITTSMRSPDGITTSIHSPDVTTTSMQSPDATTTSVQSSVKTTTTLMQSPDGTATPWVQSPIGTAADTFEFHVSDSSSKTTTLVRASSVWFPGFTMNGIQAPEVTPQNEWFHAVPDRDVRMGTAKIVNGRLVEGTFVMNDNKVVEVKGTSRRVLRDDEHRKWHIALESFEDVEKVKSAIKVGSYKASQAAAASARKLALFETNATAFFDLKNPGACYPNDNTRHVAPVSVAVDAGYLATVTQDGKDAAEKLKLLLDAIQASVSIARVVWMAQLNVDLRITHVEVGTATSPSPLNWDMGKCGGGALDALSALRNTWLPARSNEFDWGAGCMFLSPCVGLDGIGGAAVTSSYCQDSQIPSVSMGNALDFAHELGHTFGAIHTFQAGVGLTGGIMDYGNGKYDGWVQFHPANRPQLCSAMTTWKNPFIGCPRFRPSLRPKCGNKVLEPLELCECVDGSTSCGTIALGMCVDCTLSLPSTSCSTKFAMRHAASAPFVAVSEDLLASTDCCSAGLLSIPKTPCGSGVDIGVCGEGGQCNPTCGRYSLDSCGFDASGCVQLCKFMDGGCRAVIGSNTKLPLSIAADHSVCYFTAIELGTCQSGTCGKSPTALEGTVWSSSPTTLVPTARPTTMEPSRKPSSMPSRKSTSKPSRSPSIVPSRFPSVLPSVSPTRIPSVSPSSTPSSYPTSLPSAKPTTIAPTFKTKRPTKDPTRRPTRKGENMKEITKRPSHYPTTLAIIQSPTAKPTRVPPTKKATPVPTARPAKRTRAPTNGPSKKATRLPTARPTKPTRAPSDGPSKKATRHPTARPTKPTRAPSDGPSKKATRVPTSKPTRPTTKSPITMSPTIVPSPSPTGKSQSPTRRPSKLPTYAPSTMSPSQSPTMQIKCEMFVKIRCKTEVAACLWCMKTSKCRAKSLGEC